VATIQTQAGESPSKKCSICGCGTTYLEKKVVLVWELFYHLLSTLLNVAAMDLFQRRRCYHMDNVSYIARRDPHVLPLDLGSR
jgi:hypothetical protein